MPNGRPPFHGVARRALAVVAAAAFAAALAPAALGDAFHRDRTPLPPGVASGGTGATTAATHGASGGGTAVRLVLGLGVVLALVWVVRVVLNRTQRRQREPRLRRVGGQIAVLATAPLGGARALHLVSVGDELVLVGSAEQSVTPIRIYDAAETRALLERESDGLSPGLPIQPDGGVGARLLDELRRRTAR